MTGLLIQDSGSTPLERFMVDSVLHTFEVDEMSNPCNVDNITLPFHHYITTVPFLYCLLYLFALLFITADERKVGIS